jgi:hypothetical protein
MARLVDALTGRHGYAAARMRFDVGPFALVTNDDLTVILVQWPRSAFDSVRANVEGSVRTALQAVPGFGERAFRDAELLAECICSDSPGEYEPRRNAAAMPIYQLTCQLATLAPRPEMQQLLASLRGNQAAIDRLIDAIVGTVPIPDFFAAVAA